MHAALPLPGQKPEDKSRRMVATRNAPCFHTVATVASLLGVDAGKILRWLNRGELIGVDISLDRGGKPRWRISQDELDSFLRRRSSSPPAVAAGQRRRAEPPQKYFT